MLQLDTYLTVNVYSHYLTLQCVVGSCELQKFLISPIIQSTVINAVAFSLFEPKVNSKKGFIYIWRLCPLLRSDCVHRLARHADRGRTEQRSNPLSREQQKILGFWAVVLAQLVEQSLPTPEVRSSNPVIGKIYWTFVYCQLYWKDENKEKRGREWPIF